MNNITVKEAKQIFNPELKIAIFGYNGWRSNVLQYFGMVKGIPSYLFDSDIIDIDYCENVINVSSNFDERYS